MGTWVPLIWQTQSRCPGLVGRRGHVRAHSCISELWACLRKQVLLLYFEEEEERRKGDKKIEREKEKNRSDSWDAQGKENQMEAVRPDSTEPVAAEAPRVCSGSPLARKRLPLASGEGGQEGPHGQVCELWGLRCPLPPRIPPGKDCTLLSCSFPIYKWASLEFIKRVCPGTSPWGTRSTVSGCSSYYWGRRRWAGENERMGRFPRGSRQEDKNMNGSARAQVLMGIPGAPSSPPGLADLPR